MTEDVHVLARELVIQETNDVIYVRNIALNTVRIMWYII